MLEATSTIGRRTALLRAPLAFFNRGPDPFLLRIVPREGTPPAGTGLTEDQIKAIIKREGGGDSHKAIRVISRERFRAAERAREAEEKLAALEKAGRIAPEKDFVVLQGDDAKGWPELQKYLGESKLTIPKLLEQAKKVPDLETRVTTQEKSAKRADAARDLGWNRDALDEVLETKGLAVSKETIKFRNDENETVSKEVWCVRKADDSKAEWTPLDEYAGEHLKIFLPALTQDVESESGGGSGGSNGTRNQQQETREPSGTRWPKQAGSKTPPAGTKDEAAIREESLTSGAYNVL